MFVRFCRSTAGAAALVALLIGILIPAHTSVLAAGNSHLDCTPLTPTPPSVSRITPVATALHQLPPLGPVSGDPNNLDRTILTFLEVRPCDINTRNCQPLVSLTYVSPIKGQDAIVLKNDKYQVNWNIPQSDRGKQASVQIRVAGLLIDETPYAIKTPQTVPVQFRVDNHPRIRARVLHEQGQTASQIAAALISEFHLTGFEVTQMLNAEQFSSIEIAEVLKATFNATPDQVTAWMRDAGVRTVEIARALFEVYHQSPNDVADTLRRGGFSAADVFSAIKATASGWTIEIGEDALQSAGFCESDVFATIQPDLVQRYETWASTYGPVAYLEQSERYQNGSTAWYLNNSYVHWVLPGGACPAAPDLANGGPCNTKVGQVTPEGLVSFIESQFIHNTSFLSSHGIDPTDADAVRGFVESLDVRIVQKDLAVTTAFGQSQGSPLEGEGTISGGNAALSKVYVHVIRNKTPGTTEFNTTDLEFWFFYPYNGPGTLQSDTEIFGISLQPPAEELDPLGTHIPDWENTTLRISNVTGQILQVTGSAHGDVRDLSLPSGLVYESGHPIVYASRNGHSMWGVGGDNPLPLADFTKSLSIFGTFGIRLDGLNIANQGVRIDTASAFQLMAVYDTCVDRNDPAPGLCEAMAPVQPADPGLDNLHQVTPIGSCTYLDGFPLLRPYDTDSGTHNTASLAPAGTSAALMKAICPHVFTVKGDGSPAPNGEWWLTPHFGPEKSSTLGLNRWEKFINVEFGPAVAGAFALACTPFLPIPFAYPACLGILGTTFEVALPFLKDTAINKLLPAPGSPFSPYWHKCTTGRDRSC